MILSLTSINFCFEQVVKVRHLRVRFAGKIFFSAEVMCRKCVDVLNHYMTTSRQSDNTGMENEEALSNRPQYLLNFK